MWDSHHPSSTMLQEWEGVGSRRHICAILPPHCCQELQGTMTYLVIAPCPPSLHILSPPPSFPTIPTSCCFHSVVTWQWWPLNRVCLACGWHGDMASSLGVIWGIMEVMWHCWQLVMWCRWCCWWPVMWRHWAASSGAGDMASLGSINDVVVSLSASLPWVGPNAGSHQGARWWWWGMVVVVVGRDGGCHNV